MLWVLSLHIMTLLIWVAAAVYIPLVLIQVVRAGQSGDLDGFARTPSAVDSIARFVFTHIATPAAVLSISAGSAVFLINQSVHFWLLVKLTLVTFLCALQAALGLLIIRAEREQFRGLKACSVVVLSLFCVLMLSIVWIVLAKPVEPEWFPWTL
ncbi:CopD family protein [Aliidiomarina soli]|uniref:Protoporphyrinogen IX oxidase n=1 Tax=Aliidiomarina soli TaxID=1928574 RepID=A0A432WHP3_9GAMM|nr:CopD family protein [Aliidiomarina soli]RUO33237.1 hypothetical protein CWE14_08420 [Aliidiomarina soli]